MRRGLFPANGLQPFHMQLEFLRQPAFGFGFGRMGFEFRGKGAERRFRGGTVPGMPALR